jgi:hypothetical protein
MLAFAGGLPIEIQAAIAALVVWAVSAVFNWIVLQFPFLAAFLGPYKDQFIVAATAALVGWAEIGLGLIPAAYDPIVAAALQVLVALLVVFGLPFIGFKAAQRKSYRMFR